jgi:hypothetical protein
LNRILGGSREEQSRYVDTGVANNEGHLGGSSNVNEKLQELQGKKHVTYT